MAQLYDVDVRTINYHLKKVFADSELDEDSVILNFRITAADGKTYDTKHYNLSAIIAVGYKVIVERADSTKEHMGRHTWTDAPHGKIQKFDVAEAARGDRHVLEPVEQVPVLGGASLDGHVREGQPARTLVGDERAALEVLDVRHLH